jgi:glycosyltransferase involved in cell wall biosynthesis
MKILQIGNTDLVGTRFNGQDLHQGLRKRQIHSEHCVWEKRTNDSDTWQLADFPGRWKIQRVFSTIEKSLSVQSLLYPFSWQLAFDKRFRSADVVHYHLIHTGFFGLTSFPILSKMKPSVWTLHDPWAMTGHCVHPFSCEQWKTGCRQCPDLNTPIQMSRDRTSTMFKIKKWTYQTSNIDIVVASKWMLHMAKQSPLLSKFRINYIPFGINLEVFRPLDSELAKKRLGVFPGSTVIALRAIQGEFKGLFYIKECLRQLESEQPICLLTFNERGLLEEFRGKYQIIDLGWVNDVDLTVSAYNASDIFLMPSTAEAFGMMAMEAMACGKPVITFDETSLPEVVFAPHGGISVPKGNVTELTSALERFINNPDERLSVGNKALNLAKEHYDFNTHVNRILDLYADILERRKAHKYGR